MRLAIKLVSNDIFIRKETKKDSKIYVSQATKTRAGGMVEDLVAVFPVFQKN